MTTRRNVLPCPGLLLTVSEPPIASAMRLANDSPRPEPPKR